MLLKKNITHYLLIIIVVEYALSLPGTNATTERVFSSINKIWTTEKTQMNIKTLKYNLTNSCEKFHDILINDPNLLQSIHLDQKYYRERKSYFFFLNKKIILIKNHNVQTLLFTNIFIVTNNY